MNEYIRLRSAADAKWRDAENVQFAIWCVERAGGSCQHLHEKLDMLVDEARNADLKWVVYVKETNENRLEYYK